MCTNDPDYCMRTAAECDGDRGGVRQCPADLKSYWSIMDTNGEVRFGGPGHGCCDDDESQLDGAVEIRNYDVDGDGEMDETVTQIVVSVDLLDATFTLSTLSVSHVKWYISAGQTIPGRSAADDWEMCRYV